MIKILSIAFLLLVQHSFAQCFDNLVWSDEFEGTTLDMKKWTYQTGDGCPSLCGWGNNELEYYTNSNNNIRIESGNLIIESRKETTGASKFTSGKIVSAGLFSKTYGRFESRIRLPKGRGLWPAFWMLPDNNTWPMTGEIDIMENRGDTPSIINGTLHYGSSWPNNQNDTDKHDFIQDLSGGFHVYSVEWDPDVIRWYIDDVLFKTETRNPNSLNPASSNDPWPWNKNFHILLNLAVGGWFTGVTNAADVELIKPTFEIDYIRVYEYTGGNSNQLPYAGKIVNLPARIEAENFDYGCGNSFYDTDPVNQGHIYRYTPVDIQKCFDIGGGYNIAWVADKEWTEYTVNVGSKGIFDILLRTASKDGGGQIRIDIDGIDVSGITVVPATGDWQNWQNVIIKNITIVPGIHVVRLYTIKAGFNWNYMEFKSILTSVKEDVSDAWKPTLMVKGDELIIGSGSSNIKSLELVDLLGKKHIVDGYLQENNFHLSIHTLSHGLYLLKLTNEKNEDQVLKFIK